MICRGHLLLDKLFTRIHKLFASAPQIALIEGTIVEVKSTPTTRVVLCTRKKIVIVVVKVGQNQNSTTKVVVCKRTLSWSKSNCTLETGITRIPMGFGVRV